VVVVVVDDVFLLSFFVVVFKRGFSFFDIAAKASSSLSDELSPPNPFRGLPRLTTIRRMLFNGQWSRSRTEVKL